MSDPRDTVISQATFHLCLIKKRVIQVNQTVASLCKAPLSFDYLLDLDHAFLDVRKIIEELMLLSVCAHDFAQVELSQKLRKEWNADRLMRFLEGLNPKFFPDAIDIVECDVEGVAGRFINADRPYLTREEAASIYNFCGGILHASNNALRPETLLMRYERLADFDQKIRGLLQTFEIDISGQHWVVVGQLLFDEPGEPPELFTAPHADTGSLKG